MYRADEIHEPVHTFEGFGGVVKEYVWRLKGGENDANGMRVIVSPRRGFLKVGF